MAKRKKQSAKSARPTQVGEQMRQALSTMLLEGAIKDPRVQEASIVTITDVAMTPDLKQARVYVSIFPEDEKVASEVLAGLESASGATQREVAARLQLRFTPRVRFFADESIREGAKIEALLKEIQVDEDESADEPSTLDADDVERS